MKNLPSQQALEETIVEARWLRREAQALCAASRQRRAEMQAARAEVQKTRAEVQQTYAYIRREIGKMNYAL